MRAVIQRVTGAEVIVSKEVIGKISQGLCVLIAFNGLETKVDFEWMARKIINLRIFSDGEKMNINLKDINGELLMISQFTLYANSKKGNRPSFIRSAKPELAKALYLDFLAYLKQTTDIKIETGEFGADMELNLSNNGPVTIILDSENKDF
jgi:D-tyrosyl-tRNA(Tyr) deacylase